MGYYNDDEMYDDYVTYDSYEEHEEIAEILIGDIDEKKITEILDEAGLLIDANIDYFGPMEALVFLHGHDSEVYSKAEIRFIETVKTVIIYPCFYKKLGNDEMLCRPIVAKIDCDKNNAIQECISFEKIINKAFDGFNIFMLITNDSIYFGNRLFGVDNGVDCTLSLPIDTEKHLEEMIENISLILNDDFMRFYADYVYTITDGESKEYDYDSVVTKRRGLQSEYIDEMTRLSKATGLNFSAEVERYRNIFESPYEESFVDLLEEVEKSLSFIKSNRVNTYEILFEAEETERLARKIEEENEALQESNKEQSSDTLLEEIDETILDDPEEILKFLQRRKGL